MTVKRRTVFYIPGFDPFHPRRYRELYRRESAAQARISGYEIAQSADGSVAWNVTARIDGCKVESRIEVLLWADIVKASMAQGIGATYFQMLRTAWIYIQSGALWRLAGLRKGPVIAALYPVGMLLVQALIALAICVLSAWLGGALLGVLGGTGAFAGLVKLGLGLCVGWGCLRLFKSWDHRLYAYYLMQDYAFSACESGRTPPQLADRLAEFAVRIEAALESEADEVLLVGHSSGAHLGVQVLAALLRRRPDIEPGRLSFLSLGQVVPMVSFLPEAWDLRRDLSELARKEAITWVDVTAPGDGCAFALCDPVGVSGVALARAREQGARPLVLSAAFTRTLSPERWSELRWRFFRLHFQYLCAFDRPGDYDYFQITAGPLTLAERYAGRRNSPSCISDARSGYRSVTP